MPVFWNGDEVAEKMKDAAKLGVDQTTAAAVIHAKENHGWKNISGTLEGSIQMRPAKEQGGEVIGEFGSYAVDYAIFMELLKGETAAGVTRTQTGGSPFLRPAADAEYPNLPGRIRENYES